MTWVREAVTEVGEIRQVQDMTVAESLGSADGSDKKGDIKDAELFGLSNWVDGDVIY